MHSRVRIARAKWLIAELRPSAKPAVFVTPHGVELDFALLQPKVKLDSSAYRDDDESELARSVSQVVSAIEQEVQAQWTLARAEFQRQRGRWAISGRDVVAR